MLPESFVGLTAHIAVKLTHDGDSPAALREWASKYGEPVGVWPVLDVDTSRAVAIDEIIDWVTAQETAH